MYIPLVDFDLSCSVSPLHHCKLLIIVHVLDYWYYIYMHALHKRFIIEYSSSLVSLLFALFALSPLPFPFKKVRTSFKKVHYVNNVIDFTYLLSLAVSVGEHLHHLYFLLTQNHQVHLGGLDILSCYLCTYVYQKLSICMHVHLEHYAWFN